MLPHTRAFTRDGCIVGARLVTYRHLRDHYRCRDCGGRILAKARWNDAADATDYWAECADCGGRDFVSEWHYQRQVEDFGEIVDALPDDLRALVAPERDRPDVSAAQAIADLFGP